MQIITSVIRDKGTNNEGDTYFVRFEYPQFVPDKGGEKTADKLNAYYLKLAENVIEAAKKSGAAIQVSYKLCRLCEKYHSLYFDIKRYKDNVLVAYRRISDNRNNDGTVMYLSDWVNNPRKLLKKNNIDSDTDWFVTPESLFLYKCDFKEGDGVGLRRSEHTKYMKEIKIDKKDMAVKLI